MDRNLDWEEVDRNWAAKLEERTTLNMGRRRQNPDLREYGIGTAIWNCR
jgi:hypothetical protein